MVDAFTYALPPAPAKPEIRRERLVTHGEGNGKPEAADYEWRAAERQRIGDTAARLATIRAQAVRNRAAELGITIAEAEQLQREAREFETRERQQRTTNAGASHLRCEVL